MSRRIFSPIKVDTIGHNRTSTTPVVLDDDGNGIELRIMTGHWPGDGYRAYVCRQRVYGAVRVYSGRDTREVTPLEGAPEPGCRFDRTLLARLHRQVLATIQADLDAWKTWGMDCAASPR